MNSNYLKKMGITTWHLREKNASENYFCVRLNDANNKLVGMLLADIDHTVSQQEQENVLKKIVVALTRYSQCEIVSTLSQNEIEKDKNLFFILLGNSAKKLTCAGQVIQSHSLSNLMSNVEYKKQLWQDIKPLRDLFL